MSRVAIIMSVERVVDDGGPGLDIKVGPMQPATVPHFADPGDDSCPLPGDSVALDESSGSSGAEHATGYADTKNAGIAKPGEKRFYSRDTDGKVLSSIYMKNDGTVELTAKVFVFKGDVKIEGKLDTSGEVTAKAGTPAAVKLSTHKHLTPMGPSQSPTPGT